MGESEGRDGHGKKVNDYRAWPLRSSTQWRFRLHFIGDYSGITVDSKGVGHSLWTDIRFDALDPADGADQDHCTTTISAP